ncbi:hypothetical protein, partial [Enterobacter hormaechei]|uniref:hypothetical protein n=1 Tax=Enterobacter hormaechei TaxID=158836 RepID=UPI00203F0F51
SRSHRVQIASATQCHRNHRGIGGGSNQAATRVTLELGQVAIGVEPGAFTARRVVEIALHPRRFGSASGIGCCGPQQA